VNLLSVGGKFQQRDVIDFTEYQMAALVSVKGIIIGLLVGYFLL